MWLAGFFLHQDLSQGSSYGVNAELLSEGSTEQRSKHLYAHFTFSTHSQGKEILASGGRNYYATGAVSLLDQ